MSDEEKYIYSASNDPSSPVAKVRKFLSTFVDDFTKEEVKQTLERYAQNYAHILEDYLKNIELVLVDDDLPWGTLSNLALSADELILFNDDFSVSDPNEEKAKAWLRDWASLIRVVLKKDE